MEVLNIHERQLSAPAPRVGVLIDSLSSLNDSLWPRRMWPAITFDRPLAAGAVGGHGPIRYVVESYVPGSSIRFRFTGPKGFDGRHGFEVLAAGTRTCILRHTLAMSVNGRALFSWPLVGLGQAAALVLHRRQRAGAGHSRRALRSVSRATFSGGIATGA